MRILRLAAGICAAAVLLLAQGDRGTVTGTVADQAGGVVANANVQMKNLETGAQYEVATTSTGNYTLVQVPAGNYDLSVSVPGFKKYVRNGITVIVAQTLRLDVSLEVGSTTEEVTVTEAAPLLKTESGELSHAIETAKLDDLPVLGVGAQSASTWGLRNPLESASLIPGTFFNSNTIVKVNGGMTNSESIRIEGQDATDKYLTFSSVMTQPSVDSIQEVAIQTSNYAAEYGQVGGGLFNFTMKSGTNQFHGLAYDYFVNTIFNASQPYTNLINAQHRNDFGGNLGGPVWIPKLYNGKNKTFFFFNVELYRENQLYDTTPQTVPTNGMRNGDFSALLTPSKTLGTDPLGRPILQNTIYDPDTTRTVTTSAGTFQIRDPFTGNIIPASRMDPVALKIQALIPLATNANFVNNIVPAFLSQTSTTTPAYKMDQYLGSKSKISFYISSIGNTRQYSPGTGNADGLPLPITAARGNFIRSWTSRANYEYTISPTLLFHLGVGYQHLDFEDKSPVLNYNAQQELGLSGATIDRNFPTLTGLLSTSGFGGMVPMGPGSQTRSLMIKPTGNASLTWVRGNHTYKTGTELRIEGYPAEPFVPANGSYAFSAAETGLPYLQNTTLAGGAVGAPYASFLLGQVDSAKGAVVTNTQMRKHQIGLFLQDTWKITRKLTLDYGLRWDYETYLTEQYGRVPDFSETAINPQVGLPGAVIYEGSGPGHCNCQFAHNYPYAFAPRLGGAYQITPTWVARAGFGVVYADTGEGGNTAASSVPVSSPSFGIAAMTLSQGLPLTSSQLAWPNLNPGQYPIGGIPAPLTANLIDPNAGRPPRQVMWSVGLQHSFGQNLMAEASYVGNRGVWWYAPSLENINALTPQILAAHGLSLNNPATVASTIALLTSPISSAAAQAAGITAPYASFPSTSTVAQALRPFPQFTTINTMWSPLGKTWYDSLQTKVTKRLSHGLDFTAAFTWQKSLDLGSESDTIGPGGVGAVEGNIFNLNQNKYISGQDQPFVFVAAINYKTPNISGNQKVSWLLKDWQTGVVLNYASGLPIMAPYANNNLNAVTFAAPSVAATGANLMSQATFAIRVPGQPLYIQDINCHCFDPSNTFILNPKAWTDPAPGQFGGPAYYSDYRGPRHPQENLNLGRVWRIHENLQMQIRIDFQNVLNRAYFAAPTSTNAAATQVRAANGTTTAGFGYINTATPLAATFAAPGPRAGQLVLKFIF